MSSWKLADVFVLRHAGFPFDWLEELGLSDEALALADQVLVAEDSVRAVANDATRWNDALKRGVLPAGKVSAVEKAAWDQFSTARTRFLDAVKKERAALSPRLLQRARDPQIQEAVFLSNPAMFDNVWSRYVAKETVPDNADGRRIERQVYTYLQRFCAKNETTSFFGPMGYGECSAEAKSDVEVIASGAKGRRTFVSFWAVTEFAKALSKDKALRLELPLRLNPLFQRDEAIAHCAPLGLSVPLSPELKALTAPLAETNHSCASLGALLGQTAEAVERGLVPALKVAFVLRGLIFSSQDFAAFDNLLEAVRGLRAGPAKDKWLSGLTEFQQLHRAFAAADFAGRREALPKVEAAFTALTGQPARRGEGEIYSDRYVFYEEAPSPFALRFSPKFHAELAERLSPGLELSAAWGAQVQATHTRTAVERLAGQNDLSLLQYVVKTRPETVERQGFSVIPPLAIEPAREEAVQLPTATVGPVPDGPRYALPDVCLGREGSSFSVLLARVHHHLQQYNWLAAFFPSRERYDAGARNWLASSRAGHGEVVCLQARRRNKGFYVFPGRRVAQGVSDVSDLDDAMLAPQQLRVQVENGALKLTNPEGERAWLYLPLDDFTKYPPFAALSHPLVLHARFRAEGARTPRIDLGRATYQRQRWEVPGTVLDGLDAAGLLLALRREAVAQKWPRFVFVRTPKERKPYLLDTRSPFSAEVLKHLVTAEGALTFDEMSPPPEALLLRDERGRYTSELRMQAVRD